MGVRCLQMAPAELLGVACAATAHAPLAAPPSLLSSRSADANSRLEGSQSRGQEQCCSCVNNYLARRGATRRSLHKLGAATASGGALRGKRPIMTVSHNCKERA